MVESDWLASPTNYVDLLILIDLLESVHILNQLLLLLFFIQKLGEVDFSLLILIL